jgi:hypothetical protein
MDIANFMKMPSVVVVIQKSSVGTAEGLGVQPITLTFFPTDRLIDDNCANLPLSEKVSNATVDEPVLEIDLNASNEIVMSSSDEEDESSESDMLADIMTYVGALRMCETVFQEKLSERDELLTTLEKK